MARRIPKPDLDIGVLIEVAAWRRALPGAARLAAAAARAAFAQAAGRKLPAARAEAAVVLTGDGAIRRLNRAYRGKDRPTNVLAFAAREGRIAAAAPGAPLALGDVVIALQTARAEARAEGKPLADHLSHLVVHGMLHLLGHDHGTAAEARRMEGLETGVLAGLDIPDPYAPPAAAVARKKKRIRR